MLHGLAQHNHPALIALLLEKAAHEKGRKAQCVDAVDKWHPNPNPNPDPSTFTLTLSLTLPLTQVDKWRVTPLMLAAVNGNGECALLLLRHGAAPSVGNEPRYGFGYGPAQREPTG